MSSSIVPPALTITSVNPTAGLMSAANAAQVQAIAGQGAQNANRVTIAPVNVKQERHDEAEIQEMANKFREAQKAAMAKQTQQQQQQQLVGRQVVGTVTSTIGSQPNGQTNILNYLTRRSPQTVIGSTGMVAAPVVASNGQVNAISTVINGKAAVVTSPAAGQAAGAAGENGSDKKTCDEESQKGHFGWVTFGKIFIPYIVRQNEKYCAVRMVEMKLLNKYLSYLHPDIYSSCTCVRSYYITEAESRLLNEINHKHCDAQFGREMFTLKDLVVRLSDANKFYQFLDICYRKLVTGSKSPSDKCGFIRINKESVVPYTVRGTEQVVPLFYFEGETENLRQKAELLSGWDLAYLKFCCKVQGIRNELFSSESVAVISLTDIKSYFPTGTEFEDYWPSKVVDSNLLIASKNINNSVHWTRQPTAPPVTPKILNTVPKGVQQQQQQQQIRKNAYQAGMQNQNNVQRMHQTAAASMAVPQSSLTPAAVQAWSLAYAQGAMRAGEVIGQNDVRMIQAQQQVQRTYTNANVQNIQNLQNLMTARQQYTNYNPRGMQIPTINNCTQSQHPPPLVRSASQNQQHMLGCTSGQQTQPERSNQTNPLYSLANLLTMLADHRIQSPIQHSSSFANRDSFLCTTSSDFSSYADAVNVHSRSHDACLLTGITLPGFTPVKYSIQHTQDDKSTPYSLNPTPSRNNSNNDAGIMSPNVICTPGAITASVGEALKATVDAAIDQAKSNDASSIYANISKAPSFSSLLTTSAHVPAKPACPTNRFLNFPLKNLPSVTVESVNVSASTVASENDATRTLSIPTTLEVIDLSSPRRSNAAANVVLQQQQQQQQHQQQQQQQQQHRQQQIQQQQQQMQRMNTMQNGRNNATAAANSMQRHTANASVAGVPDGSDPILRVIPEITTQSNTGHIPYKVQKVFVFDDTLVPCINMKAYNDSDPLMTLTDFREYFFPNVPWTHCKRIVEALGVEMYKGNRRQTMTLIESGKSHNESIPLIQVRDVIKYMPQLRYMMRSSQIGQEQPPNKRTRIS